MVKGTQPLDQTSLAVQQKTPYLEIESKDDLDNPEALALQGKAVILVDPGTGKVLGGGIPVNVHIVDSNNTTIASVVSQLFEAIGGVSTLFTDSAIRIYNPAVTNTLERVRTPTFFPNAALAAAPATTDVWTPTAGKKFRLLGGVITMSGLIAAAANRTLQLIEETAGTIIVRASVTIPVLGVNVAIPFDLRPNGFLASTASKKLQAVTAGGTYSTGIDSVSVWGTEE